MLLVREVYSDWVRERRGTIGIRRGDRAGCAPPVAGTDVLAKRYGVAGKILLSRLRTFLAFPEWFYRCEPVNTMTPPCPTPGGLATQLSSAGHFDLGDDQAMIVTVPAAGRDVAPYQGIQLGSMWYVSLDYINHQTSLTADQARLDPDGRLRFVLSGRDPGVANWLELTGRRRAYWREQRKATGGPVYARIVNTSSEAFLLGSAGQPNYAAAKAGIAALTVTTARSCSRYGVRANAICPRARTAMTAELMGPAPSGGVDPLAPEHVAPLVVYLAGPAAETINGEVFVVHGGVAAVMEPPRVRAVFRAAGTPDGMWTLDSVHAALGPAFGDAAPSAGFLCEDTLELATETR